MTILEFADGTVIAISTRPTSLGIMAARGETPAAFGRRGPMINLP